MYKKCTLIPIDERSNDANINDKYNTVGNNNNNVSNSLTKMLLPSELEIKNNEAHNNENNNTKSITRQCGTCNDIFQILKDLSAKNLIHLTIFVVNVTINPIMRDYSPMYYKFTIIQVIHPIMILMIKILMKLYLFNQVLMIILVMIVIFFALNYR